jgi:2-methylcitrate dehydratase PrpD
MKDPAIVTTPARELADFAATLRFESIPPAVVDRTEDLFLDWFASALAGKGARPVETIAAFYESQGPRS